MKAGTLFLVVGPSGAGKDTLIQGAHAVLADDPGFVFARRAITRPATAGGEDLRQMTPEEFRRELEAGGFMLSWSAYGLDYGIPSSYVEDLASGRHVVANVSRSVIDAAMARFDPVRVIHVTAPPEVLARRLARRGREDETGVRERLARADLDLPAGVKVTEIMTDAPQEAGVRRLVEALKHAAAERC